jgi:fermentation-respiration switch protein FrsA (DUF1100 family)
MSIWKKKMSFISTIGILLIALVFFAGMLVACERQLIYHPMPYPQGYWEPETMSVSVEDVHFQAEDGIHLHGWYVPSPDARATLLWFHGNAGNITHRLQNIKMLEPLKLNIFIFDYRGYGKSKGQPNEKGIYMDSQAAYDFLMQEKKTPPEKLILFGRSLGGVFAVDVATKNPAAGLILESVFTTAQDMAKAMFPILPIGWALSSKLDNVNRVSKLKLPKLFLHGDRDSVVPFELGRQVFSAAAEPKEFYEIKDAGHNDTIFAGGTRYFATIDKFISRVVHPDRN